MITQSVMRQALSDIFGIPNQFIVPKQGNWYNPQDKNEEVATWCAFIIRNAKPRVVSFKQNTDVAPILTNYMIGRLEMQFVGALAETLAQSISLWLSRDDVTQIFTDLNAQLLADGLGEYEVSNFDQEGLNTVLAYNVSVGIEWANMIQPDVSILTSADFTGGLHVDE